jgi:hypothetical protein
MPALKLTAKGVKCTLVATPDQIAGFHVPDGSSPVPFAIDGDPHPRRSAGFGVRTKGKSITVLDNR